MVGLLLFTLFTGFAHGQACEATLGRRTILAESFARADDGRVAVALFDADDTLRTSKKSPGDFVDAVDDVQILPGVVERLRELNRLGLMVVIVSNQGGVPKHRSLRQIDDVLSQTIRQLGADGAVVHYYDFAENYDEFRKPNLGMIRTLERRLSEHFQKPLTLDRARSFMVGDAAYTADERRPDGSPGVDRSNSDRLFAENLGVRFYRAPEYFVGTAFAP